MENVFCAFHILLCRLLNFSYRNHLRCRTSREKPFIGHSRLFFFFFIAGSTSSTSEEEEDVSFGLKSLSKSSSSPSKSMPCMKPSSSSLSSTATDFVFLHERFGFLRYVPTTAGGSTVFSSSETELKWSCVKPRSFKSKSFEFVWTSSISKLFYLMLQLLNYQAWTVQPMKMMSVANAMLWCQCDHVRMWMWPFQPICWIYWFVLQLAWIVGSWERFRYLQRPVQGYIITGYVSLKKKQKKIKLKNKNLVTIQLIVCVHANISNETYIFDHFNLLNSVICFLASSICWYVKFCVFGSFRAIGLWNFGALYIIVTLSRSNARWICCAFANRCAFGSRTGWLVVKLKIGLSSSSSSEACALIGGGSGGGGFIVVSSDIVYMEKEKIMNRIFKILAMNLF